MASTEQGVGLDDLKGALHLYGGRRNLRSSCSASPGKSLAQKTSLTLPWLSTIWTILKHFEVPLMPTGEKIKLETRLILLYHNENGKCLPLPESATLCQAAPPSGS